MSKMEDGMENLFEGGAQAVFRQSLNPVQITKRAVKEMNRNKLVGTGRQYAPTLYNVLVSPVDDQKLIGFYPTLSREIETQIMSKAQEGGLAMDGKPLVRFIVDDTLRKGKFDVIAESVSSAIIKKLRAEEMFRYGLGPDPNARPVSGAAQAGSPRRRAYADQGRSAAPAEHEPYQTDPERIWASEEFPARTPSGAGRPTGQAASRPRPATGRDQAYAQLIDCSTGETFEVHSGGCVIGREEDCDVRILDANVSRHHATIDFGPGGWSIEDLHSTNGTQINHHSITRAPLHNDDVITMGVTKLQFRER